MILLQQLVKHLNFVGSGGEVREFLAQAGITVNGEPESRRGRKLFDGDVVTLPGSTAVRIVAEQ